jgi:tetratricopeptide (TPR) repeat protein
MVLNDRGLIFMGYGGNDKGILRLLSELPANALPSGVYWVHPHEPQGPIRNWLIDRRGVWVKSGWFDEVMLLVRNVFDLPHPEPHRLTKIFEEYHNAFSTLSHDISTRTNSDPNTTILKHAVTEAERSFPDFWRALAEARRLEATDPSAAEAVYVDATRQFPESGRLRSFFAIFVAREPARQTEAGELHRLASECQPPDAFAIAQYAMFLQRDAQKRAIAEALYERAIAVDPKSAFILYRFALFVAELPGRESKAEGLFRRAIDSEPTHGFALVAFANFLARIPDRRSEAETYFARAISADSVSAYALTSYAAFLEDIPDRRAEAGELHRRAVEAAPRGQFALARYAMFLEDIPARVAEAEHFYARAVENSDNAYHLTRFAVYLSKIEGRKGDAEQLFIRALEADSNSLYTLATFAAYLERIPGREADAANLREKERLAREQQQGVSEGPSSTN